MATRLENFYTQAAAEWGSVGRLKLAMLTHIPSEKARVVEDTDENIRMFENAMKQLRAGAA